MGGRLDATFKLPCHLSKELTSVAQKLPDTVVTKGLAAFKQIVAQTMLEIATETVAEVSNVVGLLKPQIIDLKAILKDYDNRVEELLEYDGRPDFVKNLKLLQEIKLKRLERVIAASTSADFEEVSGEKLSAVLERGKKTRQAARLQVCSRSAAVMVQRGSGDMGSFDHECKRMNVVMPSALRTKLDALK